MLVAAAESSEGLPPSIRRCFSHEIKMGHLTEEQRIEMLSKSVQHIDELFQDTSSEDLMKDIGGQTSGFMPRDLQAVIADAAVNVACGYKYNQPDQVQKNSKMSLNPGDEYSSLGDGSVQNGKEHLIKALEQSKKRNATALGLLVARIDSWIHTFWITILGGAVGEIFSLAMAWPDLPPDLPPDTCYSQSDFWPTTLLRHSEEKLTP